MFATHTFRNELGVPLQVWVEPWADVYCLSQGSTITFIVEAGAATSPVIESALAEGRITFWFKDEPEIAIDGKLAVPDWQE